MGPMTGPQLRLEPLSVDHLDGIMTWVNDPAVTFYFARLGATITREEERLMVARLVASDTDRIFSIFEGEAYVGQIGISKIYWPAKNGRIGIMLPRNAWGRGIAQAAARLLMTEAFGPLGLHKLWVIIRADNDKSLHLWARLGFTREGHLRDEYYVNERYYDMVRLARLANDEPPAWAGERG
jgi:diamine N-acetyltransferase